MQRRVALSMALGLTVVVVFALMIVGRSSGIFGRPDADATPVSDAASADDIGAALRYLAAIAPAARAEPQPLTEYVYVDAPANPPLVTYVTVGSPSPPTSPPTKPSSLPTPTAPMESAPSVEAEPTRAAPPPVASPIVMPTSTPVPTRAAPSGPLDEDEFTGTATSVVGEMVTFTHGGETTVVRVPSSVGHVAVGDTVKVHALLLSTGWVAKEIERAG